MSDFIELQLFVDQNQEELQLYVGVVVLFAVVLFAVVLYVDQDDQAVILPASRQEDTV